MPKASKWSVILSLLIGFSQTALAANTITQASKGDCSPTIIAQGKATVICGIPQKVVDRLLKELDEKDIKLQERESIIASWIKKYQELESQLASRSDDIAKQAKAFLEEGKLEDAEKLFKQALQNDVKNAAANAFSLAQIKVLQINYPEATTYYQQAVQLDPENALYLNDLAYQLFSLGEYAQAEPLYQRSLAIEEKWFKDSPNVASVLDNLAVLYDEQGLYARAEPLHQRSLAIREEVLGKDHPDVAVSLNNLAEQYRIQGKYELAESLYQRSLTIREKALGKDHPDVATALNNLAVLYDNQGQYAKAEPLLLRSLEIREKALGIDHPDVAFSLNNLATLYYYQGRYTQSEQLIQRSLKIWEKALGEDYPLVATSLNNLAKLYEGQSQYALAAPLFQRALAILKKTLGKDHPRTKTAREDVKTLEDILHGENQVLIKAILPASQAEKLGLQAGDILTHYKQQPILGTSAFIYQRSFESASAPEQALTVSRNGKELVFKLKPGKLGAELQDQARIK